MTAIQKSIIKQFGHQVITIDGTHGLNAYDFELTTLLTLDEHRQGFPVAFMFSNRKDTLIYQFFFSYLKEAVGQIKTSVFMSDITDTYFMAWCDVMEPPKHRLLCSWHVDRAWQTNLVKIKNSDKKSWVYKTLKYIQSIPNREVFQKKIIEFSQMLNDDEETHKFGDYLIKYYIPISQQWAYCYRSGCGLNTNMHLESFHKTIKYHYLDGKKIKRLDKSIHQLMAYIRDKAVDRLIKLRKGTNLKNSVIATHRTALTSTFDLDQKDSLNWSLKSGSNEYIVTKQSPNVCCPIKCHFCNICLHTFKCSCIDFCIRTIICKHIHYVAINSEYQNNQNMPVTNQNLNKERTNIEVQDLTYQLSINKGAQIKERIKNNIFQMLQKLDTEDLNNEQLDLWLQHTKTCLALGSVNNANKFLVSNEDIKQPTNTNIIKQKSFHSTKKKCSTKKTICLKASKEELKIIEEFVNSDLVTSNTAEYDHLYY